MGFDEAAGVRAAVFFAGEVFFFASVTAATARFGRDDVDLV